MPHNFQRPGLPYDNEALQNDKRYQIITRTNERPPTDVMFDTDFNYLIDAVRQLDIDIAGTSAGILPGADNPDNANFLPTTDGAGNITWVDISDENIRDESISASKLIPQTITDNELMDASVVNDKIAPDAVTTNKILDFNVTTEKIDDDAVTTDKIDDEAITTRKIAVGNVTTSKIADANVTTAKIADANVTTAKIADGNVTLAKLATDTMDFINSIMPIGAIMEWAGTAAVPAIFKECNGQLLSRVTYASLFAAIGTTYGAGDGATTFAVPDRRGRTSVGIGSDNSTGGRITSATSASIALGGTFGAETQTLDITQIPSHTHSYAYMNASFPSSAYGAQLGYNGGTLETGSAGGGLPHANVQPSIFMRYYIRAI